MLQSNIFPNTEEGRLAGYYAHRTFTKSAITGLKLPFIDELLKGSVYSIAASFFDFGRIVKDITGQVESKLGGVGSLDSRAEKKRILEEYDAFISNNRYNNQNWKNLPSAALADNLKKAAEFVEKYKSAPDAPTKRRLNITLHLISIGSTLGKGGTIKKFAPYLTVGLIAYKFLG